EQPAEPVVDAARAEQQLPPPGHRPDRDEHDPERGQEEADARVAEDVPRLAKVDLPEDVGQAEPGDHQRRDDADQPPAGQAVNAALTRRRASIASATSASECAGESGSESTSAPAFSERGSGGCSGKRSRYADSSCTGRKWMLVPICSSVSARWYSSRVAP